MGMNPEKPHDITRFLDEAALDDSGYVPISDEELEQLVNMTPDERGRWLAENARRKREEAGNQKVKDLLDKLGRGNRE